jgi:hypothetical protein
MQPESVVLAPGARQFFVVSAKYSSGGGATMNSDVTFDATGGVADTEGGYTAGTTPGSYHIIARPEDPNFARCPTSLADTSAITISQ